MGFTLIGSFKLEGNVAVSATQPSTPTDLGTVNSPTSGSPTDYQSVTSPSTGTVDYGTITSPAN